MNKIVSITNLKFQRSTYEINELCSGDLSDGDVHLDQGLDGRAKTAHNVVTTDWDLQPVVKEPYNKIGFVYVCVCFQDNWGLSLCLQHSQIVHNMFV